MRFLLFFCLLLVTAQAISQSIFRKADSLYAAGLWKDAAAAYQSALKQDARDGLAWYHLGVSHQMALQYAQAIEAYKKSVDIPSAIPPIFVRVAMAKAYSLNHDSTNALNLLSSMVENGYGNFPDLDTASAYRWLKQNPRFADIISRAKIKAYPCSNDPHNREFDFWLGDWDVYRTGTNFMVGRQKIEKASGGCLIVENWTAVGVPQEGKSMNFISPKTGKWEQVWMGSGGGYLNYYNGEYKDGAMRYEGDGVDKAGKKILFHLTYFNLGKDSLRQLLEQSVDEGKTWSTLYDFSYRRKN